MTVLSKDLRKILMLRNLEEQMLNKLAEITQLLKCNEGEILYEKGENAERFYMLKIGKVLLEVEINGTTVFAVSSIKPGYSFGWSALLPDETYPYSAVCSEFSEVMVISREALMNLLNQDCAMGFVFMHNMVKILKERLDRRTRQILKILTQHPEFERFLQGREISMYLFKSASGGLPQGN